MPGLVINPIWDASVLAAVNATEIEMAVNAEIKVLEATFTNSVTINLHVGWGEINGQTISPGAVAEGGFDFIADYSYSAVRAALATHGVSLPATDPDATGNVTLVDPEAVALGLLANTPTEGYVGFDKTINWNFTGNASGTQLDFLDDVAHEITHVMGRTSQSGATPYLLDFFRYSAANVHDFKTTDKNTYYSADNGVTVGEYFDTTSDPADWANRTGLLDAYGAYTIAGRTNPVTAVDLSLMKSLGWDQAGATDYSATIKTYFDAWFGRDPTAAETATWQTSLTAGTTLTAFRAALLGLPEGVAHTNAQIKLLYDTYFGRDPSASDTAAWQNAIVNGGYDFTAMRTFLLNDPAGQTHTNAQIKLLYDTYFGRDPAASEVTAWQGAILGGYDFNGMRAFLLNDPAGQAHTNAQIKLLYDTYFGRDPATAEVAAWQNVILNGGYDFTAMRAFLLADPAGQAHTSAEIKLLYDTYFGRDPGASEVAAWQNVIVNGGYDFNAMRAFLLNDPSGNAHTVTTIKSLFDTYFGRDPDAYESGVWQSLILAGSDFTTLRAALLNDPAGQAHTNSQITSLYDTYFGRDPGPSEVAAWQNVIVNGGYDFNGMRAFLLADPAGQAHTNAEIKFLYDTYFGRDPGASEVAAWQNVIVNAGYDFNGMRTFLLNDPAGVAHTTATVKTLFDTYFGRDPSAYEAGVWQQIIAGGADFHTLQDTLERQSSVIQHLVGDGLAHNFVYGPTTANLTIDAFNVGLQTVTLGLAQFGAINPLDAAHAQQITALDGTTDVLFTLDATHTLLIEHTTLSAFHASNFLFA